MKKLTKEQADWLLDRLDDYHLHTDCSLKCDACEIKYGQVKSVINQCTEKPFPEYALNSGGGDCAVDYLRIYSNKDTENCCGCDVELNTAQKYTHLTKEQFKQFTEGCQKIVEWLEEQE